MNYRRRKSGNIRHERLECYVDLPDLFSHFVFESDGSRDGQTAFIKILGETASYDSYMHAAAAAT